MTDTVECQHNLPKTVVKVINTFEMIIHTLHSQLSFGGYYLCFIQYSGLNLTTNKCYNLKKIFIMYS